MACGAVKRFHTADIRGSFRMACRTFFRRGRGCVKRRQVARQALQVVPGHVDFVPSGFADLTPTRFIVEMTFLAYSSGELGMRRDVFDIRSGPAPNDPRPVLNVLFVADFASDFFVRPLFPGIPRRLHQMAGSAKIGIILYIVEGSIAGESDSQDNDQEQNYEK